MYSLKHTLQYKYLDSALIKFHLCRLYRRDLNQRFSTQTTPRPVFLTKKFHDPLLRNLISSHYL